MPEGEANAAKEEVVVPVAAQRRGTGMGAGLHPTHGSHRRSALTARAS